MTFQSSPMTAQVQVQSYVDFSPIGYHCPLYFGSCNVTQENANYDFENATHFVDVFPDDDDDVNEIEVGRHISNVLNAGFVKRDDLFVTVKLWSAARKKEEVRPAVEKQLGNLGLSYIDLLLIQLPSNIVTHEDNQPVGQAITKNQSECADLDCTAALGSFSSDFYESDASPLESDARPLESDASPLESDASPLESDASPLESDPSPLESDVRSRASAASPLKRSNVPFRRSAAFLKRAKLSKAKLAKKLPKVPMHELWSEYERIVKDGLVRNIGITNFDPRLNTDLLALANIKPAILQVQVDPHFTEEHLMKFAQSQGVQLTAISSSNFVSAPRTIAQALTTRPLLSHSLVVNSSARHEKTSAQLLLRWAIERHNSALPRTNIPGHVNTTMDVLTFKLTSQVIDQMTGLSNELRFNGPWSYGFQLETCA